MTTQALRPIAWETWELQEEADRRFRKLAWRTLLPLLIAGLIVPFLQIARIEHGTLPAEARRHADLLTPQPAPPPPKEEPKPEPEKKAAPKPQLTQEQKVARARERAQKSLASLQDSLSELRAADLPKIDRPLQANVITSHAGSGNPAFAKSATATSGGIGEIGVVERGASTTGLGSRNTTAVRSTIGSGHEAGRAGFGDKGKPSRSLEEIQLVFDRNKGAFYTMYVREQRQRPDMVGKLIVRMTIAPSGRVTRCTVVSSELNNPEFEKKVVARVLLLDFGAKAVPDFTLDYPILFFPS